MPINYNLLSPIPQDRGAIAQLAAVPAAPSNTVGSALGGLTSGLKEGSQIQALDASTAASNQQVASSQQDMQQKAEMFPDTKLLNSNNAKISSLTLEQTQSAIDHAKAAEAAAKHGEDTYIKYMGDTDPAKKYDFLQKKASYEDAKAQIVGHIAQSKQEEMKLATQYDLDGAQLAQDAHQVQLKSGPEAAQKFYKMQLERRGTAAAGYPSVWDDNTNMMLQAAGMAAAGKIAKQQIMEHGTDLQKNMLTVSELQQKAEDGTITAEETKRLNNIQNQLAQQNKTNDIKNNEEIGRLQVLVNQGKATQAEKIELENMKKDKQGFVGKALSDIANAAGYGGHALEKVADPSSITKSDAKSFIKDLIASRLAGK